MVIRHKTSGLTLIIYLRVIDIIYKVNSAKKIFYFNIDNLVIMEDYDEYLKFNEIKNIFIELIKTVKNLNIFQRLDKNSIYMYKIFNENIQTLQEKLFNGEKWDEFITNLDKDFEGTVKIRKETTSESLIYSNKNSKIEEEEDDKESEDKEDKDKKITSIDNKSISNSNNQEPREPIFSFHSKKEDEEVNSSEIHDKESKESKIEIYSNKSDLQFFLHEFEGENLVLFQQSLYNLRFIYLINEYFTHIDKLAENKSELVGDLFCIEETLITIYKILIPFIHKNDKQQYIIKNRLYLYICPLKLKKLSSNLSQSISKFLHHLVSDFKSKSDYGKIGHMDKVINNLYLLHQIDWNLHKKAMPFFAQTLLILFEYSSSEYIYLIYQLLEEIKNYVINDITITDINNINNTDKNNSIITLAKILEFINQKESKENLNRPLLSMGNIIKAFPIMINRRAPTTGAASAPSRCSGRNSGQ